MKVNFNVEYGLSEILSTKADMHSYDILLFETLTRKQPNSDMFFGEVNLHE